MIPTLTENVSINQTLPIRPSLTDGITPRKMQQLLDQGAETIKQYLNQTLIPYLESQGAASIGAAALTPESGETVEDQLAFLLESLQEVTQGEVADGSITNQKLASSVRAQLERDLRLEIYDTPGVYSYTAPMTGAYLICLVGGGGGRSGYRRYSDDRFCFAAPPTAGGVAIKRVVMNAGDAHTLTVGAGGTGSAAPEEEGYGGANSGETTSFGTIFSATGGTRSLGESCPFTTGTLTVETAGEGINGDINLRAGESRIFAAVMSGNFTMDSQQRSTNFFSSGFRDTLSEDTDALFPGGAPAGKCHGTFFDGANGGNGACFILYLGNN